MKCDSMWNNFKGGKAWMKWACLYNNNYKQYKMKIEYTEECKHQELCKSYETKASEGGMNLRRLCKETNLRVWGWGVLKSTIS